ncbi:anti-sigma-D factor RsdA [Plantactinospora sp. B24E8]|uniref:anti-sigma-D factor RsdA n=1 Tax=Plantactinospora sp. B24E8 TaxID=3153567 RepID=UPI00325D64F0
MDTDDLLLDALGRGEPAPTGDPLASLLAAWRLDLDEQVPVGSGGGGLVRAGIEPGPDQVPSASDRTPSASDRTPSTAGRVRPSSGSRSRPGPGVDRPGVRRPEGTGPTPARSFRVRPGGPLARRLAFSTAAAVVVVALLGLGVNHARPTSPLWPIANVVYPDRSAVRAVEHTLGLAENAVAAHRYDDARRHLDQAVGQLTEVRDPAEARRLRVDLDRVRSRLPVEAEPGPADPVTPAVPSPDPVPTDRSTGRAGTPTGDPGDRSSAPRPSRSAPPPTAPTPARVLPLPVPVLPSLLPSGLPLLPSGGCVLLCPPG